MPTDRTASGPRSAAAERIGQPDLGELDRTGPQLAQRAQYRLDQDDRGHPPTASATTMTMQARMADAVAPSRIEPILEW